MAFGSKIERVQVQIMDLDLECYFDIANGRGIRIDSVEAFDTKKKNEKIWTGLQSEFFGSDFSEEDAFRERWSCKCKKYIGKAYKGKICEQCGAKVEYNDIDLTKTGWIILDHFYVMSPIMAAKISDALGTYEGEKVLTKIIAMTYHDEDEPVELSDKEVLALKKHPFIKKGMIWLHDHLPEVLDYYEKRKPSKKKLFDQIRKEYDKIWCHCIPVYSSLLRTELPSEKGYKLYKLKINTYYQAIIRLVNSINQIKREEMDFHKRNAVDIRLARIQKELDSVFTNIFQDLTGKPGIMISKILGGRYNFSSRDIIIPSSGRLRSDEIELGYIPFMELFRYEIINFYSKLTGCTTMEASDVWKRGTNHFDPTLYSIMEHMCTDKECRKYTGVLIARNPC